jgi:hypothetical protein
MVARRFPKLNGDRWHEAVHEIIGWGNIGLVESPSKITITRGFRLSTVVNQWARKHIHDGLASLVSVIHYPERKRNLAKFDSRLAVKSPDEDEDFEAFDSLGNPTNPDLELGYLQRQVGKRLFPWHDWGTCHRLLGLNDRFEFPGRVSDEAQGDPVPVPDPFEDVEFTRGPRIPGTFDGRPIFIAWGGPIPLRCPAALPEVCYLEKREGSYCSWQHYSKPRRIPTAIVGLVNHVCTDMRHVREHWHDAVPKRRQLDAYRDWDKYGNRIDKVSRYSVPRRPIDYAAHTGDGLPPKNWHINLHWRTTYPMAVDYLRRAEFRRLQRRAICMFVEVRRAAKMFNERTHDETSKAEEPLRRQAA